jgi:hypothetical protein
MMCIYMYVHIGSTLFDWDSPYELIADHATLAYFMHSGWAQVVIPDHTVPGMLLRVNVSLQYCGQTSPPAAACCWTPMMVPEGSKPGMVYAVEFAIPRKGGEGVCI